MKLAAVAVALMTLALCGCVSSRDRTAESDDMCREIADFANASDDGELHRVRFNTDWGGTDCPHEDGEDVIACNWCEHDAQESGKRFCGYLSEHTSIEFARINLARVLDCLNLGYGHLNLWKEDKHLENRQIWSAHARGVRRGTSVGVEFLPDAPPTLIIYAQRRGV